jgi:hypothetical protein
LEAWNGIEWKVHHRARVIIALRCWRWRWPASGTREHGRRMIPLTRRTGTRRTGFDVSALFRVWKHLDQTRWCVRAFASVSWSRAAAVWTVETWVVSAAAGRWCIHGRPTTRAKRLSSPPFPVSNPTHAGQHARAAARTRSWPRAASQRARQAVFKQLGLVKALMNPPAVWSPRRVAWPRAGKSRRFPRSRSREGEQREACRSMAELPVQACRSAIFSSLDRLD